MKRIGLLLMTMVAIAPAGARDLEGVLELRWGDPPPGSAEPARFEVHVVDAAGERHALDAASALEAAGNLHRLNGRRVIVESESPFAFGAGLVVDAMRAADPAPAGDAVTGSQPWVTLLCRFAGNATEPKTVGYFEELMSDDEGRLDHYWREVSYGKVDIVGSIVRGWYELPHDRAYYLLSDDGNSIDLWALFDDCTGVADADVDFREFVGINTMYNDDLDCCAWGGGQWTTLDGESRWWYITWEPPWGYEHEAPLAHEMGHGFGLPHANNSDGDGDPYDNPWDVMSAAWNNAPWDGTFGWQPKHIGIWSRDHLGWVDEARTLVLDSDGEYANILLDRAGLADSPNPQLIRITLDGEPTTRYYVIESRKRVPGYESQLAGDAVIIHEVDTTRSEPAWSVDADIPPADVADNPGSMFTVGESWTAPGDAFRVDVVGSSGNGFVLDIRRGRGDVIFADGFE